MSYRRKLSEEEPTERPRPGTHWEVVVDDGWQWEVPLEIEGTCSYRMKGFPRYQCSRRPTVLLQGKPLCDHHIGPGWWRDRDQVVCWAMVDDESAVDRLERRYRADLLGPSGGIQR